MEQDLINEHREMLQQEANFALKKLVFSAPFLALLGVAGIDLLFGISVVEPIVWFLGLFPSLLLAWIFGHRPLVRLKQENRATLKAKVRRMEEK